MAAPFLPLSANHAEPTVQITTGRGRAAPAGGRLDAVRARSTLQPGQRVRRLKLELVLPEHPGSVQSRTGAVSAEKHQELMVRFVLHGETVTRHRRLEGPDLGPIRSIPQPGVVQRIRIRADVSAKQYYCVKQRIERDRAVYSRAWR